MISKREYKTIFNETMIEEEISVYRKITNFKEFSDIDYRYNVVDFEIVDTDSVYLAYVEKNIKEQITVNFKDGDNFEDRKYSIIYKKID